MTESGRDDGELTAGIRASDESAFKELYLRYYDDISRYIWYRTGSKNQVEDMVQEVFVRLWGHRMNLNPEKSVKAYLYRTASNLIVDSFRKRGSKHHYLSELNIQAVEEEERMDTRLTLQTAIARLPVREQKVVILSRYQGLKYKEIAEICGISVKTVESRMTKAFKRLRNELGTAFIR